MRPNPVVIGPQHTLARAADLMTAIGARELPVVDGASVVGILTRTDMEPYRGHFEWTLVRRAMTPDPVVVDPEMPIGAVARLLLEHGFNSLPVVIGGTLLGMISAKDFVHLLAGPDGA